MNDDTDTINIAGYIAAVDDLAEQPTPPRSHNAFLIAATMLFTAVAAALVLWMTDPMITHAQVSMIASVVLIVGAAGALICHVVRGWMASSEARVVAAVGAVEVRMLVTVDGVAKRSRALFYGLGSDIAATSAEVEALKALTGDFIKRYPPAQGHDTADAATLARLQEQVETLAEMVANPQRVVFDMPNEDVYELGRRVGREEAQRRPKGHDQSS